MNEKKAVPRGDGHTVHCTRPMICCSSCPELGLSASPRSSPTGRRPEAVRSRRRTGWLPTAAGLYGRTSLERSRGPSPPPSAVPSEGRAACGSATWRVSAGASRDLPRSSVSAAHNVVWPQSPPARLLSEPQNRHIFQRSQVGGKTIDVPLERPWRVAMRPATGWLGRGSHFQKVRRRIAARPKAEKKRPLDALSGWCHE